MAEDLKNKTHISLVLNLVMKLHHIFQRVLFKITMLGATYLVLVLAILPIIITKIFNLPSSVQVGGTSLIIVVGVAIETYNAN